MLFAKPFLSPVGIEALALKGLAPREKPTRRLSFPKWERLLILFSFSI